jgi:hypothetical protein
MADKKSLAAIAGAVSGAAAARGGDLALLAASLFTAAGAVGFAGYMAMWGTSGPLINGMEYLAIFAQPSHVGRDVDMNPVGSILRDAPEHVGGYALVGAEPRFAWLREGNRIFAVRPGDDLPRLGRVAAIEQRDGRWELLDEKGATLIAGALVDLAPSAGGRFDKRMIFGAGK